MILPIITLLVGVAVVGVSFFILDSHDFKEEDEIYNERSRNYVILFLSRARHH